MTTIKRMGKRETQNGCCCPGCPGGAPMAMRVFHSFKLINFFRTGKSRGRTAFGKCFKSQASGFSERMSRILLVDRGGRQYLLRQVFVNRIANPYGQTALLTRPWDRTQFAKSRFALGRGASEGVYPARSSTERATKPQGKTALARRVATLLACGFVARRVTERCGYAPLLAPRHKPKSLQQTIFYPTVG